MDEEQTILYSDYRRDAAKAKRAPLGDDDVVAYPDYRRDVPVQEKGTGEQAMFPFWSMDDARRYKYALDVNYQSYQGHTSLG